MPDFYHSSYEARLDPRVMAVHSNAPIGIPRVEQVTSLTDNKLSLHGPPIEINHPSDYNDLDYRCNNGGETMKYGIAGVYNITDGSWRTGKITDVDEFGTTITFYDAAAPTTNWVDAGDTCMVYYYARVAYNGGSKITALQGDQWIPEIPDILHRKCNDSMPSRFGALSGCSGNTFKFATDCMYNDNVAVNAGGFTTVLDYSGTGTFRQSDWPVYMTEIKLNFAEPGTWPDYVYVRITIDGEEILRQFNGTTYNYLQYFDMDSSQYAESSGPYSYTPGSFTVNGTYNWGLFFDLYEDVNGQVAMRLPIKAEILSDLKIEMYPATNNLGNVDVRVMGWFID